MISPNSIAAKLYSKIIDFSTFILKPILYAPSLFWIRALRKLATGDADQYGRNLWLRILRIFAIDIVSSSGV